MVVADAAASTTVTATVVATKTGRDKVLGRGLKVSSIPNMTHHQASDLLIWIWIWICSGLDLLEGLDLLVALFVVLLVVVVADRDQGEDRSAW